MFYEQGSRGINIEANPQLINDFITHRPEDINLNIGINDERVNLIFISCRIIHSALFQKRNVILWLRKEKI